MLPYCTRASAGTQRPVVTPLSRHPHACPCGAQMRRWNQSRRCASHDMYLGRECVKELHQTVVGFKGCREVIGPFWEQHRGTPTKPGAHPTTAPPAAPMRMLELPTSRQQESTRGMTPTLVVLADNSPSVSPEQTCVETCRDAAPIQLGMPFAPK
jgi:hypothetical protein